MRRLIVISVVMLAGAALLVGMRWQDSGRKSGVVIEDVPISPPPTTRPARRPAAPPAAPVVRARPAAAHDGAIAGQLHEHYAEDEAGQYAADAFPPPIPDTQQHRDAWSRNDCLRCHETGVQDAPMVVHRGMAPILLRAKCRSCHVLITGYQKPPKPKPADEGFDPDAFPPMIPASEYHLNAWTNQACLLCHESGVKKAPIVKHEGMPPVLLTAKCRSCHVQVRASELLGHAGP